jgi:hypothetical protein
VLLTLLNLPPCDRPQRFARTYQGAEELDNDGVISRHSDFFEAAPRGLKARATA